MCIYNQYAIHLPALNAIPRPNQVVIVTVSIQECHKPAPGAATHGGAQYKCWMLPRCRAAVVNCSLDAVALWAPYSWIQYPPCRGELLPSNTASTADIMPMQTRRSALNNAGSTTEGAPQLRAKRVRSCQQRKGVSELRVGKAGGSDSAVTVTLTLGSSAPTSDEQVSRVGIGEE